MATSLASPLASVQPAVKVSKQERGFAILLVTGLTFGALLLHGYHPYAEDGGVYLPEIKRLVDPSLYPYGAGFVVEHLRFSVFAPMIAEIVRLSRLRVETVMFFAYLASFWLTLFAFYLLAARCCGSRVARSGAVMLLTAWITLPIAGTSLMLMDPYVTARSLSTPCALFALVGALDCMPLDDGTGSRGRQRMRGLLLCAASLAAAIALHLLMGAYAVGSVLLLVALMTPNRVVRVWGTMALVFASLAAAASFVLTAPSESDAYQQVVVTRYYWFLSQWHWYEWVGVVAPLLILASVAFQRGRGRGEDAAAQGICRTAFAAGSIALLIASLFARPAMQTHLVARLQPLRIFQLVYLVMILMLGAAMAEQILRQKAWRWIAAFAVLGGVMMAGEQVAFPASNHIEYTEQTSPREFHEHKNAWEQAFVWISRNTPKDAVFALDAHYITQPGEDAQGFRAIAERSVLPDYSKDGGIATNKPDLTPAWVKGVQAQTGLNAEADAVRIASLEPLGVTWLVLSSSAITYLPCQYVNVAAKVCRLP